VLPFHDLLAWLRIHLGHPAARDPAFWMANALVALLVPSPSAAPVLLARPPNKE